MAGDEAGVHQRTLQQISNRLHELFDEHIDLSDVLAKTPDERENYFLTRSYIALYLVDEVGLLPGAAAYCVTDGGNDDGVDAICVDKKNTRVYLCQSKWRKICRKRHRASGFCSI